MSFSQSQQAFGPQQQQTRSPVTQDFQHLTAFSPPGSTPLYKNALVQPTTIYILPNGTFSYLQPPLVSSIHLTVPRSAADTTALRAAQTFYAQNSFAIAITTISFFTTWTINDIFKPSEFITRLAILYGPPTNPGGGNAELAAVLSMPNLRNLRLIFQDYEFKGLGPYRWLRPSISVIMSLKTNPNLNLKLQLQNSSLGPEGRPEDIDADDVAHLEDITNYLDPPTEEEERIYGESRRIIASYKGPFSSHVSILREYGWSGWDSLRVVREVAARLRVRDWVDEGRVESLGGVDVEMT